MRIRFLLPLPALLPIPAHRIAKPPGFAAAYVTLLALLVAPVAVSTARAASIEARRGAVAAEHRLASEAGVEILKRGGNAVDAVVASALVTGVVNASSSGLGGGGFLVVWDARRGRAETIDFRETAPRGATEAMFLSADGSVDAEASRSGSFAVAVPGEPRGLALALTRHGKLSFAEVAAPAIRIAREGFPVSKHLAGAIASAKARLAADPGLAQVFLHPDGTPLAEGETLRRPALAATLERLATAGVDDFYEGEIAADLVQSVAARTNTAGAPARQGAHPLDARDLAAYRPVVREPLRMRYRGRDLYSMPPPSSGGGLLAEALAVLGGWEVGRLDRTGPTYAHALAETLKAVFADRALFYGDPAFASLPLRRLLSPDHAAAIRARIDFHRARPAAEWAPEVVAGNDAGTSHLSVIDQDGNAAALTTSINTGFGAALSVPGRDVLLNNTMDDFSVAPGKPNAFGLVGSKANAVAPGKRPLSSMTPTIVVDHGTVRMVAGASGGPLILTSTLQVLVDVLDFGLGAGDAVAAPRLHHQWLPDTLMLDAGIPDATRRTLEHVGQRTAPLTAKASVQAVVATGSGDARRLEAASDPRKGGEPAGW